VYTLSETASDAEADRYAQRENRADLIGNVNLRGQSDDVANILVDLTMRGTLNGGNRFAGILMDSLAERGISLLASAPHRSAGFAVLKSLDIPSALIEMGYLSDIGDAHNLADPQYRTRFAQAVALGIDRYFAGAGPMH
jgi:N-acetylmuramoyl-L-alanine amidase